MFLNNCLTTAKPGQVYDFMYKDESYRGTVVTVRNINQQPLQKRTLRQNHVLRSDVLLTMRMKDGTIRSFYAEPVAYDVVRIGWLDRFTEWLLGLSRK